MQSMIPLVYVLVFVVVVATVQLVENAYLQSRDRTRRVNRRLTLLGSGMSHEKVYSVLVRQKPGQASSSTGSWRRFRDMVEAYLRQADLNISIWHLLVIAFLTATTIWLAGVTILSVSGRAQFTQLALARLGASFLTIVGLWLWIRWRRIVRLHRIEQQLPLALDIINRGLRAGHPVISAVQLAANEMGDPLGSELGLVVDETTYGVEFKEALANFARRTNSSDARFFAVSVSIQSETGGNLAEILEGLSKVMRSRANLAKRVKVLASEGWASAYILSALPPAMIAFQLVVHPQTYTEKFSDPIFWPVIGGVGLLYLLGWVIINRIVNFKY